jgi:selenocysteine-specific elongation factor
LEEVGEIAPKKSALAQIVLREPVVALAGDRFVIRDETNVRTLGGGVVLNPMGRRMRKPPDLYLQRLNALTGKFSAATVEAMLNLQDTLALTPVRIAQLFNLPLSEVDETLGDSRLLKVSLGDEEGFATAAKWNEVKRVAVETLAAYHRAEPLSPGIDMESLRTRLPYEVSARAFRALVERLTRETDIVREESILRLKSHRVQLGGKFGIIADRIEELLNQSSFHPPDLKQLAEVLKLRATELPQVRAVLLAMEREGRVVKIATDLYFGKAPFESAKSRLIEHLAADGEISAATYRDLLKASRKYAIALLDHFDHSGVTTRIGDVRRLRSRQ